MSLGVGDCNESLLSLLESLLALCNGRDIVARSLAEPPVLNVASSGGGPPPPRHGNRSALEEEAMTSGKHVYISAVTTFAFGSILLSGCGGASVGGSPKAALSATSLVFANQDVFTSSGAQTITLSNSGTGTLSNLIIGNAGPNFAETSNCASTMPSGANCTISVTFIPTNASDLMSTLSITDDAPGSPQNVLLSGTGTRGGLKSGTLDGFCLAPGFPGPGCAVTSDTSHCPPGQSAKSPGYTSCGPSSLPTYVDPESPCAFRRGAGTGECEVVSP